MDTIELYHQYKALLFTLAYQLTGSTVDAEDVVQEVFVKIHKLNGNELEQPKAYLCKMVTNQCYDLLKSAQRRREQYFGTWLPEPVATTYEDPMSSIVCSDLLSYAMLVLLERLAPVERTVFILREALGFDYPAIAQIVNKNEANCRKLLSRARNKMGISEEEPIPHEPASEEWVMRLLQALRSNNVDAVVSMLHEDIVVLSDGGGKVSAAAHPITTPERVAQFLIGLMKKTAQQEFPTHYEFSSINGQAGMVVHKDGRPDTVILLHSKDAAIRNIYFVRNPDKLVRL
ncbi:RNA polymerase sigma factor SigJ [Paenibacillus popilliae]|uniref:Sigma-70 family RNA polymerase sigma factor n=1 Tax=Paenibacillus popilliae TaxID=78057 RepID=A0ABY3AU66_PAEPP|nr:RNA polymerase sigma factor SigJ [Paenibacillus sp. SDF0028]TQR46185.1 sigma-70 family RNA polymerase sigma factor [Paenibacillus sp. SDF0028]